MRVIVIGGGIVGSSCAYHAAAAGAEVVLIDDGAPGQATAAGAGIVSPWARTEPDPDGYRLSVAAAAYYPHLIDRLTEQGYGEAGYHQIGSIHLSTDEAALHTLRDLLIDRRRDAPQIGDVRLLPPGEPQRLFPPLRDDIGGVWVEGSGRVDGRQMRDALQRAAAEKHGVTEHHGRAALVTSNGRIAGVRIAGQQIDADTTIVAAGAWSTELAASVGVHIPVEPQRGQIVHAVLPHQDTTGWPIVEPPDDHYLLAFPGSRVVFGATRESGVGFDDRITVGGIATVLHNVLTVAPGVAGATITEIRVGLRPLSIDGLPVIGAVPDLPGLVVATGMGPTGLTLGPYAGRLAAQLALNGTSEMDIGAFNPVRLKEAPVAPRNSD